MNWEYLVRIIDLTHRDTPADRARLLETELDEFGEQGWELVAVKGDADSNPTVVFKKPRERT